MLLGPMPLKPPHILLPYPSLILERDDQAPTPPAGWIRVKTKENEAPLPHFYHNMLLGESQWEHPAITSWRSVMNELQVLEDASFSLSGDEANGSQEPERPVLWVGLTEQQQSATLVSKLKLVKRDGSTKQLQGPGGRDA